MKEEYRPADFRRDAYGCWLLRGALAGGALAGTGCVLVGLIHAVRHYEPDAPPGWDAETLATLAFSFLVICGLCALLGAMLAICWQFLARPTLLAIFASPETFQREYGTPEEQGIVEKRPRPPVH